MATLASILFILAVVSVLGWVVSKVRRGERSPDSVPGSAIQKKKRDWWLVAVGILFAAFGLDAAVRGQAELDIARVSGTNVRIGGALLCAIGSVLVVRSLLKRDETRA